MPWCPACDTYLAPPAVRPDGTCPRCGGAVESAPRAAPARPSAEAERAPVPWHLKLLLAAVAVYLGYRSWQGIEWVLHHV